jgi:Tfp pilus assembly protein PilX
MKKYVKSEKGIALLIALFALLLLSAVGLSMMFSADAETSINSNYREKQQVNYASLSGVLEARDRLQPANTTSLNYIPFPTNAPTTASKQIWYIINPSAGETVAPWDSTNKFADTELCQENGPICSSTGSLPTGAWYQTYDDSSYTGAYKLTNPLLYKWTRVQLKTDNAPPQAAWVGGSSASGKIVCWDGINQVPLPAGYNNDCSPHTGSVSTIILTNPGTGYNSAPHVNVAPPPSGSTALATAVVTATPTGSISSITLDNPGSGYTSQPTVTITGIGTGATAVANIVGGTVTAVNLTNTPTQCYQTAPAVSISGGGGTGAQATAVLGSDTCVVSVSGGKCNISGWKNNTLTVTANNGSGFSASITFQSNGVVVNSSVAITNPGTGYSSSSPPTQFTSSVGNCTPTSTWVIGKHVLSSLTVTNGGSGYATTPTVYIAPGTGTAAIQPAATASISGGGANAGQITSIAVTNGGSGYTVAPLVTISGGGGTGGAGTAVLGTIDTITGITVDYGGSGYLTPPGVTFTGGGGGTGVAAQAYLSNGVYYGRVLTLTSMAITKSGSKAMTQMEVATPPRQLAVTGALTLAGPSPSFAAPNSSPFTINGNDNNSCASSIPNPAHPAVGVYDNPNSPTTPTAQASVIAALPRPANYIGAKPAPDIENVYSSLGDSMTTPAGLDALATGVASVATNTYGNNPSGINLGSASNPTITVVNGSVDLSGNVNGYGILLVTGTLTMSGNFSWHGVVLVIGQGISNNSGGGNGQIIGTMLVAKTRDTSNNLLTTLGSPTLSWNGGGGNGITYDHCWADNMLANVPYNPPPTTQPLKVLSTRTVTY